MTLSLRPYQSTLIRQTAAELAKHKRVITQLITGGGKTFIFSNIIGKHLQKDIFNRVLVLTHRVEIFSQTVSSIVDVGITVTELQSGQPTKPIHSECRCLVAMVETLKRRDLQQFGRFSLIIVDECHRKEFQSIIDNYPDTYIIGTTATPLSSSKKHPLKDTYNSIVTGPTFNELIQLGYLAKPNHYKAMFDESVLRKRAGEFTATSQLENLHSKVAYENHVELWQKYAGDKKTIVFCVNKEHTIETTKQFQSHGIAAEYVLSGTSNRDGKISGYINNEYQVLVNCGIAIEGFNVPDIECVDWNTATTSLTKWLQANGRGSRVTPTKKEYTILDFGGNIDRHGLVNIDRDWKQIFWNPKKAGQNPAPHRECIGCGALLLASVRVCEYCGATQPTPEETERKRVLGYLEKVGEGDVEGMRIDDLTITQLYHLELAGKYKPSFVARVARTRGVDELEQYRRLKGYSPKWVKYQEDLDIGYQDYIVRL